MRICSLILNISFCSISSHYSSYLKGEDMDFERIAMKCVSKKFQTVFKLFHSTIPESKAKIMMVERIKNDFLHERYNRYIYV